MTDSERAALVNSVVDSDDSTDEDDSDASGDTGSTDTCVWKDIIIYIGWREMFTGVCGPLDSKWTGCDWNCGYFFNYF